MSKAPFLMRKLLWGGCGRGRGRKVKGERWHTTKLPTFSFVSSFLLFIMGAKPKLNLNIFNKDIRKV
jgi:hypothetical protein